MSKTVKKEKEENIVEEVRHWDPKRIAIALVLLLTLIGGVWYFATLKSPSEEVLGTSKQEDKPQIELPTEREISNILEDAKESLSEIDVKDVVSSQPQIEKIINDLQQLTKNDNGAKNLVCDSICK